MSQFTIAADGKDALRVTSVELSPPDHGYTVDAGRHHGDDALVSAVRGCQSISDILDCKTRPAIVAYIQDSPHGKTRWSVAFISTGSGGIDAMD